MFVYVFYLKFCNMVETLLVMFQFIYFFVIDKKKLNSNYYVQFIYFFVVDKKN